MTKRFQSNWVTLNLSAQSNTIQQKTHDEKTFAEILQNERERAEREEGHFSFTDHSPGK